MQSIEITLGRHRRIGELRRAFKKAQCWMHPRAEALLPPILAVPPPRKSLRLQVLSVADLGFEESAAYAEVCAVARGRGLRLCPDRVGPYLRLQSVVQQTTGDLRSHKFLYVAMTPLLNCLGKPFIFAVIQVFGANLLYADWVAAHTRFYPNDHFVFLSP